MLNNKRYSYEELSKISILEMFYLPSPNRHAAVHQMHISQSSQHALVHQEGRIEQLTAVDELTCTVYKVVSDLRAV